MKVLIYSSEEIYENADFEGRAEADLIAVNLDGRQYRVTKDRFSVMYGLHIHRLQAIKLAIRVYERNHDDTPFIPPMPITQI